MEKLIFVYNANSGKINGLLGSLHKVMNPSTYTCKLCELTYGTFEEKKAWRNFRKSLDFETEFLHKDEFLKSYASKFGHKFEFPVILAETNNGLEVMVSRNALSQLGSTEELINSLEGLI